MEAIPNLANFRHITVIPDGDLYSIPFDALESPSGKLLADTAVTAYSPSAVSYYLLRNRSEGQTARSFLGVGGAIYNSVDTKPFTLAQAASRGAEIGVDPSKLPNLPSSGEEVRSAAKILKTANENITLQVGPDATESAFMHAPLSNFQIVHLAIHAVADKDDPSRAALIFPYDPQHQTDSFLEPSDIVSLHLGARVVVLSACSTAVGRLQGQVGVANLARAFLQAGADSVVSTLWPVDDLQSLFLMKAFLFPPRRWHDSCRCPGIRKTRHAARIRQRRVAIDMGRFRHSGRRWRKSPSFTLGSDPNSEDAMKTEQSELEQVRIKATELIRDKLFHPYKDNQELIRLSEEFADLWPSWLKDGDVEAAVNAWLRKLNLSHTGFWRGPGSGLPSYFAINAVIKRVDDGGLVFWDVLPGGIAQKSGIIAGDVLLGVDGQPVGESEPRFRLGGSYTFALSRDGVERSSVIQLPGTGPKDRPPMAQASPLTFSIDGRLAILKVTSFPGAVGFDLLRDLRNAIDRFAEAKCDRLIMDLRSNCGGGLSSVRLMSLLVPDRRLIGYSLTRRGRDRRQDVAKLPAIRRLPASRLGLLPLAVRFKLVNRDRSFRLFTEGLGSRPFHGRIAVLVNEYTRSAAEMVAAFACNESAAHVIGTRTPGEVLGAANFNLGSDYRLRMPVTAWYTASDELIEGSGVQPQAEQVNTVESIRSARDLQMQAAMEVLA
jgi:carboxyl-terminal processing protease